MKQSVQSLRDDLSKFQNFFGQGTFLSFSAEEREALLAESNKYLRKLESLGEGVLTVGLLGGTGVGKSSTLNALAGAEIASTSYRRPHTDQVLIYHHASSLLPIELQKAAVPWREITHHADSIKQILLCDLPDFDSLLGAHREHVLQFLEFLDVLVWVTSPEKYADERFYVFLREAPKAKQNFYFVLNKADLLFEGQSKEVGYEQLTKVTANFQHYLTDNGVSHPLIYTLSASQMGDGQSQDPWNQFSSFRHQIFQHRDIKEISAIKAANLDVEVQHLVSMLDREVFNLASARKILKSFLEELERDRAEWVTMGDQAFDVWLEGRLKRDYSLWVADFGPLIGPGRALAAIVHEVRKLAKKNVERGTGPELPVESMSGTALRRGLERLDDRMTHRMLSHGLPAAFKERIELVLDSRSHWDNLVNRLNYSVQMWLASSRVPAFGAFQSVQYLTYFLLTVFFLLAIGGEPAWQGLIANPSWAGLARLTTRMIQNLFSPIGLAGLGSFVVLNLFFAFRFYSRFKKLLQRHTQKFIESLKLELQRVWEGELDSVILQLKDYDRELEENMSAIESLHEDRKRD